MSRSGSSSNSADLVQQMACLANDHRKRQFPNTIGASVAKASRDTHLREKRKLFDQSLIALLRGGGLDTSLLSAELDRAWHASFDQMTAKRALPYPLQGPVHREMSLEYYKIKTMWAGYVDAAHRIAKRLVEESRPKAG